MKAETEQIERYLHETLGITATLESWPTSDRLPLYLRDGYRFYQASLLETSCLLMVDRAEEAPSPATVRKQMDQVQPKWDGELVYIRWQVASHQRKRLIEQRVPFLVPGNQLYLPMLGIDLREHFRKQRQTPLSFKPATQTLVLELLLNHDTDAVTPSDLVSRLGYSKMSMSRAFDELEVEQLCEVSKEGRERYLRLTDTRKDLWEKARPLMQSPVQRRSWVRRTGRLQGGVTAGLSALAEYSMLAAPGTPTVAVSKDRWKSIRDKDIHGRGLAGDPDAVEIEVWTYDPELFAKDGIADRFSLFLALQGSKDERVEAALDEMMEAIPWSRD